MDLNDRSDRVGIDNLSRSGNHCLMQICPNSMSQSYYKHFIS
jgi:hypothetical protein